MNPSEETRLADMTGASTLAFNIRKLIHAGKLADAAAMINAGVLGSVLAEELIGEITQAGIASECKHESFDANCQVMKFDVGGIVIVRVACAQCKLPIKFVGMPEGLSLEEPCMAAGGHVAHLPMRMPEKPTEVAVPA